MNYPAERGADGRTDGELFSAADKLNMQRGNHRDSDIVHHEVGDRKRPDGGTLMRTRLNRVVEVKPNQPDTSALRKVCCVTSSASCSWRSIRMARE